MDKQSTKQLTITVSGAIFLTTVIGLVAFILTQNSALQISSLSDFGSYFGGVLGPILSFITILILLKDREDNDKRNNLSTAIKMYDYTKIILKNKEDELIFLGRNYHGQQQTYTGFEVVDHFQHQLDLDMFTQDTEYVFIWVEDYVKRLKDLYEILIINKSLQELLIYEFSNKTERFIQFSLSYKEFENAGLFDDEPNIRRALKQTRQNLISMFPDYLSLRD